MTLNDRYKIKYNYFENDLFKGLQNTQIDRKPNMYEYIHSISKFVPTSELIVDIKSGI